jgi:hypothetical protein
LVALGSSAVSQSKPETQQVPKPAACDTVKIDRIEKMQREILEKIKHDSKKEPAVK